MDIAIWLLCINAFPEATPFDPEIEVFDFPGMPLLVLALGTKIVNTPLPFRPASSLAK